MKADRIPWTFGVLTIVLSLAPFYPEPHLWGKIKWVAGGAVGMEMMDWLDLLFHGGPLVVFLFMVGVILGKKGLSK